MSTDCIRFETETVISDLIKKNFTTLKIYSEFVDENIKMMKTLSHEKVNEETLSKIKFFKRLSMNRLSASRRCITSTRCLLEHHSKSIDEKTQKIVVELLEDFSEEISQKMIEIA